MDPLTCLLSFGLACTPPPQPAGAEPDEGRAVADAEGTEPAAGGAEAPMPEPADAGPASDGDEAATDDGDAGAEPGSASAVLAEVQQYYDQTDDLRAKFRQTYLHPVYGTKTVNRGTLMVKKPGMMIWDYQKRSNPDFYADGNKLWVIERDTRQVVTKKVSQSDFAGAVKFLFGGSKLIREFWVRFPNPRLVKQYGMKGHDVVELMPKSKNPHYKRLLLVVDRGTGRVDAFVVRNADGSVNHFELSNVTRNPGLAKGRFEFEVPEGYVVVRE